MLSDKMFRVNLSYAGYMKNRPTESICLYKINIYKYWLRERVTFQNNPGQVNICLCISYSVYSNANTTLVRIYGEPYAHIFCAVDNFWNITHRLAISPVATSHDVLRRGFMIPQVILIFIKCLSANQNQLFYMKV